MNVYARSVLAGAATGIRSTTGLTALTLSAPSAAGRLPDSVLGRPWVKAVVPLLAVAESVMDKLPGTPPRTAVAPFAARLVAGAACGLILARRIPPTPSFPDGSGSDQPTVATTANPSSAEPGSRGPLIVAAVLAAAGTAATTLLGPRWRSLAAGWFGTDSVGSFLEDAAGITLAAQAAVR